MLPTITTGDPTHSSWPCCYLAYYVRRSTTYPGLPLFQYTPRSAAAPVTRQYHINGEHAVLPYKNQQGWRLTPSSVATISTAISAMEAP
jgi:hypothetical protein